MVTERPEAKSKPLSLLRGLKNLLGVGLHLLLLGLLLEGLTIVIRQWISFPIPLTHELRILLTAPCVAACLLGMIPALLPYKGASGQRYRERCDDSGPKLFE